MDIRALRQCEARIVLWKYFAEQLHRIEQLARRQMLVAEHQHRMVDERAVQPFPQRDTDRLREVDAATSAPVCEDSDLIIATDCAASRARATCPNQQGKVPVMASGPQSNLDFTRFFADMKLPALPDMETFLAANRKNLETLSAANRVALEGAQAVARRHMEIVQSSMAELTEAMQRLPPPTRRRSRRRNRRSC